MTVLFKELKRAKKDDDGGAELLVQYILPYSEHVFYHYFMYTCGKNHHSSGRENDGG